MSLSYPVQNSQVLFGSKDSSDSRTAVALTGSYSGNQSTIDVGSYSKINLDVLYTMGSGEAGNTIEIKVEGSNDGTNWYRLPNESTSGGTSTLTRREFQFQGDDAASATISVSLDIFYEKIRVSVKESGVSTNNGTIYMEAIKSGK